ncbi:MAG: hypothetical protein ABW122_04625 [Ilumatobacteraceae bacterium]
MESEQPGHPLDRVQLHELEAMRRSLAMAPSLSTEETLRLINTLSDVLSERVQMERKLADLRPAWGRTREGLNELAAILKR